jgi:hypothetical protein
LTPPPHIIHSLGFTKHILINNNGSRLISNQTLSDHQLPPPSTTTMSLLGLLARAHRECYDRGILMVMMKEGVCALVKMSLAHTDLLCGHPQTKTQAPLLQPATFFRQRGGEFLV